MIYFEYGNNIKARQALAHSMFRDRASQFSERLKWAVTVSDNGEERDEYDQLNPLYVIVTSTAGHHAGSMRFLPTIGRTMVNDHFLHLNDGVRIESPVIWECTRFCLGEGADRATAAKLLAAGGKLMRECGIEHFVGVFDHRMERIYRLLGASPTILGRTRIEGQGVIGVGLWSFDDRAYDQLIAKARITKSQMDEFFGSRSAYEKQMALSA